jgi:hypothetical protein
MQARPLLVLAALAAATQPDLGKQSMDDLKGKIRDRFAADPMGTTVTTVLAASYLFYKAEKGKNPKVNSYYDALVYVSTNLSVGYSDIFAKTPTGKAIGTALMTYGPSMAAKVLDTPVNSGSPLPAPLSGTNEVTERLDKILAALERLRDQSPPTVRDAV